METTYEAKFELIKGLTGKSIAIFNADNEYTLKMADRAKKLGKQVWLYSTNPKNAGKKNYATAVNIKSGIKGISFEAQIGTETAIFHAEVYGKHLVTNMLGAITAAYLSGVKLGDAARAAIKIKPLAKTIEPVEGVNGSLFINDTFNNNPDAAKATIDFLAEQKGRKFLVFQPMIELGNYADISHKEVGAYAARFCDEIILTNKNFNKPFIDGVVSSNPQKQVKVMDAKTAAEFLKNNVKKGDAVLFKGKEAENVLNKLV